MKKIIISTDFSSNAENAIQYALQLFANEKCAFYLLNAVKPPVHFEQYTWHGSPEPSNQEKSLEQLTALVERLSNTTKNPEHLFIPHSAMNNVSGEIKELVQKEQIDIIVMGKQGTTGAKHILFGSNTTEVIRSLKCPVITVPADYEYNAPKHILFATDLEITYGNELLKELQFLATHHQSQIAVLHIKSASGLSEQQENNKEVLDEVLGNIDHRFHLISHKDFRTAINDFQAEHHIDFLAMVKNKHTFIERLFLSSNIKQIGLRMSVPFMVLPFPTIK
ncbi:universal stress protein [Zeaxanthinibacter sp. PT1]|uniref:universal stress protein n=1 Tax=Zeaxanthinibacter TaxID=561554 RepID=UPI00234BE055|nr:universal stress protein [Zeaxanthinibacter sp. PT1]MDC6351330.1 universal stress protein [Zeaxanthinibacter sp. PT1]